MTGVFQTDDGKEYTTDQISKKEKCDFCGELGQIASEEGLLDGELPSISSEGYTHSRTTVCRQCLTEGIPKDKLENEIGTPEEVKEKMQSDTVEL